MIFLYFAVLTYAIRAVSWSVGTREAAFFFMVSYKKYELWPLFEVLQQYITAAKLQIKVITEMVPGLYILTI
jgi:hypothetical protein